MPRMSQVCECFNLTIVRWCVHYDSRNPGPAWLHQIGTKELKRQSWHTYRLEEEDDACSFDRRDFYDCFQSHITEEKRTLAVAVTGLIQSRALFHRNDHLFSSHVSICITVCLSPWWVPSWLKRTHVITRVNSHPSTASSSTWATFPHLHGCVSGSRLPQIHIAFCPPSHW